ncbi:MAG: hypothetical protein H8E40_03690 [Chloroflexi bacterium]|nr:hypothetical protein [Chloroflexota bacterium]
MAWLITGIVISALLFVAGGASIIQIHSGDAGFPFCLFQFLECNERCIVYIMVVAGVVCCLLVYLAAKSGDSN